MTDVIVWSGWIGGLLVGLYALLQLALFGSPLGVSTGYGNVCALTSRKSFFSSGPYADKNSWRLWFMVGLPLGGLLAALLSPGAISTSFVMGAMYDSVLPQAIWAKGAVLAGGGVLMGLGARMAGGCTSGHAIAGITLLNWPSVVSAVGFFVGGIVAVQLIFRFAI